MTVYVVVLASDHSIISGVFSSPDKVMEYIDSHLDTRYVVYERIVDKAE